MLFIVSGNETYNAKVVDGVAETTAIILPNWMDLIALTVTFYNSSEYKNITTEAALSLTQGTISMSSTNVENIAKTNVTLTATVVNARGENVTAGNVSFTDKDGVELANVQVINGTTKTVIVFNQTYNGKITATYIQSKYYQTNTTEFNLIINSINTIVSVDAINDSAYSNITLVAHVTDSNGGNVTGGTVTFTVNNKAVMDLDGNTVEVNVTDGVASYNTILNSTYIGDGRIVAQYTGVNPYNSSIGENTSYIANPKLDITILTDGIQVKAGKIINIVVLITHRGKIVTHGVVTFKFNSVTLLDEDSNCLQVNVTNGFATANYTIPSGYSARDYVLNVVYGSNEVYERTEVNGTVTVIKSVTYIKLDELNVTSPILS